MKEFECVWQQCPHVHHDRRVVAEAICKDHVRRTYGIDWFKVHSVEEAQAVPHGKVLD